MDTYKDKNIMKHLLIHLFNHTTGTTHPSELRAINIYNTIRKLKNCETLE